MRAIVLSRFGGPEELELKDIERPRPKADELLVKVIASGTNPVDAKLRANGGWAKLTVPLVLGYDASGVVEEAGAAVTDFRAGDQVFFTPEIYGNRQGTYADYTVVKAAIVAPKPKGLSHIEAAAVPLAGGTAWEAVVRRLRVAPGETILIHGGAGGVGSFAVQIAKAVGARVLATASAKNLETLRELDADVAIDYASQDFVEIALTETKRRGVDAVFDCVGGDLIGNSIRAVRHAGRLAHILPPGGDLSGTYRKSLTLHGIFLQRERARLEEMTRLIDLGRLKPVIYEVLPLAKAAEAHRRLDSGHGRGKTVLEIAP